MATYDIYGIASLAVGTRDRDTNQYFKCLLKKMASRV